MIERRSFDDHAHALFGTLRQSEVEGVVAIHRNMRRPSAKKPKLANGFQWTDGGRDRD
jgi:hypothetical protein